MRRLVPSVLMALGLVMVATPGAYAGPAPVAAAQAAAPGKKVCTVTDERLTELSGMVAVDDGFIVVNDSTDFVSGQQIFFLDRDCAVTNTVAYPSAPLDTEDLALSPDGKTLWVADIGDNDKQRERIALWKMPVSGAKQPVIHRLSYPDGKFDAEALVINGDGTPVIITKTAGTASLYSPAGPLRANNDTPVEMAKVGEVKLPKTDTSNPLQTVGRLVVTGAATSPDGKRVVLRTYADALEWDAPDGDVVKAMTSSDPRITPLPDEPFGEAIAYGTDGKFFFTVSDAGTLEADVEINILRYTPSTEAPPVADGAGAPGSGDSRSWFDKLSLQDITYLVGAVGVFGAVLVGAGIFGIVRARRGPSGAGPKAGADDDPDPILDDRRGAVVDPIRKEPTPAAGRRPGGEYRSGGAGSGRASVPPVSGGVYGGAVSPPTGPAKPSGGVYGQPGGGQYRSGGGRAERPDERRPAGGYRSQSAGVYGAAAPVRHPDHGRNGRTPAAPY